MLQATLQQKAIDSIAHIASIFCNKVGIPLEPIRHKLKHFSKKHSTAALFTLNASMVESVKHRDAQALANIFHEFIKKDEQEFIRDHLVIEDIHHSWWSRSIALESLHEINSLYGEGFAECTSILEAKFLEHHAILKEALSFLMNIPTLFFEEVNAYVSHIILFDGKGITGASSTKAFGAIFIRIPPEDSPYQQSQNFAESLLNLPPFIYYLEQIVHETSHLHLDALMEINPCLKNAPELKYNSPIRNDLRPMRGVFHATYILGRLFLLYLHLSKSFSGEQGDICVFRLNAIYEKLQNGINTVTQHALLTEAGKKLLFDLQRLKV